MQTFLGFKDKRVVGSKVVVAQYIIYMLNLYVVFLKSFTKQHIFISILLESFIERMSKH